MELDSLCLGCMKEKGDREVCPLCGYSAPGRDESSIFLPPRTVLHDKYLIGRVLGQGGFGITYLAWDINLDIKIAVKEFFPQGLVSRDPFSKDVITFAGDLRKQFEFGLQRFLHEAKTLAHFADHPNIVTVRDFFRANGTAYMVMNYVEGMTLEGYLEQVGGKLTFQETRDIMMPVLDALKEVHFAGIMHRDISPDNIFINTAGRVVLIDFGAARQEMRGKSKSLSVILKTGYAPEEQYRTRGEQGPWTDIYAVAATMYRTITGEVPMESMDRLAEDLLILPSELGAVIEPHQEQVLLKAMAVRAKDRYRTIEEFQGKLFQEEKLKDPSLYQGVTNPDVAAVKAGQKGFDNSEEKEEQAFSPEPALPVHKAKKQSELIRPGLIVAAALLGGMLIFGGISFLGQSVEDIEEPTLAESDTEEQEQLLDSEVIETAGEADYYKIDHEGGSIPLSDLPIGARVVDHSWEWEFRKGINYSNYDKHGNPTEPGDTKPVTWIVVAKNHYDISDNHVTLLSEELIGLHAFDNSTDRDRDSINHWGKSGTPNATRGLRPWLNSSGIHAGEGFYQAFSESFRQAVMTTSVPNREWRLGTFYSTEDNIFIPSTTELGDTENKRTHRIGETYSYFKEAGDARRVAGIGGSSEFYWTRSPVSTLNFSVRVISRGGGFIHLYYNVWDDELGVRPALNMKSEILVSEIRN